MLVIFRVRGTGISSHYISRTYCENGILDLVANQGTALGKRMEMGDRTLQA